MPVEDSLFDFQLNGPGAAETLRQFSKPPIYRLLKLSQGPRTVERISQSYSMASHSSELSLISWPDPRILVTALS